jgi:hypothetical protein
MYSKILIEKNLLNDRKNSRILPIFINNLYSIKFY